MTDNAKKHRFNIIDAVLILAVLACIAGAVIRSQLHESVILHNEQKAGMTVLIEAILDDSTAAFHKEDTFSFSSNGETLGTLKDFVFSPAKVRFFNDDGTITQTQYYDRSDVVCTFEVSGYNTENGFMINGNTYIGCGSTFNMRSKYIELQCTVLDLVPENG